MTTLHVLKCICHGRTFVGRVPEEFQGVGDSEAAASVIDLEYFYGPEDQQASMGFSSASYSPVAPDTPGAMPTSYLIHSPSSPLPFSCGCGLCGGMDVQQRPYIPVQMSPDLSQRNGETFTFSKGGCGVLVVDAMKNRLSGLVGGDDLMFIDAPVSTYSLRIEWPGYRLWTGKFRAKNWGGPNGPVTRARLVSQLGKRIGEFVEAMEGVDCADLAWKVGSNNIAVDNIVLVSLTRVSKGSWQPHLRLLP